MTIPSEIGVKKLLNEQSGFPDKGRGVGHWLELEERQRQKRSVIVVDSRWRDGI